MTEIRVERREGKGRWRWLVLLLVVVLLGAAGWYVLAGPGRSLIDRDAPAEVERGPGAGADGRLDPEGR